ncbi:Tyrosinase P [Paramyrothecium foliicola]|nr:Tyrosinase P [Paramyrothecium foliicola]
MEPDKSTMHYRANRFPFNISDQAVACMATTDLTGAIFNEASTHENHEDHPFPNAKDIELLQAQTGLEKRQILNWFANRRRRVKPNAFRSSSPVPWTGGQPTKPINVPPRRPTPVPFQNMNPLERWEKSPPDSEGVALSDISRAASAYPVSNFDSSKNSIASSANSLTSGDGNSCSSRDFHSDSSACSFNSQSFIGGSDKPHLIHVDQISPLPFSPIKGPVDTPLNAYKLLGTELEYYIQECMENKGYSLSDVELHNDYSNPATEASGFACDTENIDNWLFSDLWSTGSPDSSSISPQVTLAQAASPQPSLSTALKRPSRSPPAAGSSVIVTEALRSNQRRHAWSNRMHYHNASNSYWGFTKDLTRFVQRTTSLHNPNSHIPSDEELRYQARWIWCGERSLSNREQDAYTSAVQCLMNAPSKGVAFYDTLQSRYDDFVAMHINATRGGDNPPPLVVPGQNAPANPAGNMTEELPPTFGIHGVGIFLPWHRYAIWTFESALRVECNYTGTQPYWDWTLDNSASNGSMLTSPLWRSFGSNSSSTTGCVEDGAFAGITLNLGPENSMLKNPRCLKRAFDMELFESSSQYKDLYPFVMSRQSYAQVQYFIDGLDFLSAQDRDKGLWGAGINPHSLGHMAIGGDLLDIYSSPNDPLFWVHHTLLDYLWASWQKVDTKRLTDISGSRTMEGLGPSIDKVENTTLDTPLWMGFMNEDIPVSKVMDPYNQDGSGVLCYEYEESPSLRRNGSS